MSAAGFCEFWDALTNYHDARERAEKVEQAIKKYNKKTKTVLELGVGIGAVLRYFPKKFNIYGLDILEECIKMCRQKLKRGTFFVSSMHDFQINQKFDVIFSVFDSINFLRDFNQWKKTFQNVNKHLNEKGLFIFDMYTTKALQSLKGNESTREFSKGIVYTRATIRNNLLTWDCRILEKKKDSFNLHKYLFKEKIFSIPKVRNTLKTGFTVLETKYSNDKRRIFFVCRKKQF